MERHFGQFNCTITMNCIKTQRQAELLREGLNCTITMNYINKLSKISLHYSIIWVGVVGRIPANDDSERDAIVQLISMHGIWLLG